MARQWRGEQLISNYVFKDRVVELFEKSQAYLSGHAQISTDLHNLESSQSKRNVLEGRHFQTLIVDYLSPCGFRRIQDAIDAASDFDKVVVKPGVYMENIYIDKPIMLVAHGYVELRSTHDNVITCCAAVTPGKFGQQSQFSGRR